MIEGPLTLKLKEFLKNVKNMRIMFNLQNITASVQEMNLIMDFQIKQKFLMSVKLDIEYVRTNFTTDRRWFDSSNKKEQKEDNEGNLKIRQVPGSHHFNIDPPQIGKLAGLLLMALTLKSIFRRYSLYKSNPIEIVGITKG